MKAPVRIKHTAPPPKVCGSKCWWRAKYVRLLAAHKKLRRDYIEVSAKYHAAKRNAPEVEGERAEPDVLEMIG